MIGKVIWFTGLPGSGKTTLATGVVNALIRRGGRATLLDGDALRGHVSSDLGFDREGRREAVRRAAGIARVLAEQGQIVAVALVSPYAEDRAQARQLFPPGAFIEVFVDAPVEVCRRRDPKGHYRRAANGDLSDFTGHDAPYEAPEAPELHLQTEVPPPGEGVAEVLMRLAES